MILSVDPTSLPPMNTSGTRGLRLTSMASAFSISLPLGSSSSSCTAALTPRSWRRLFTVWHMQHELMLKTTTARWDTNFFTLISADLSHVMLISEVSEQWEMESLNTVGMTKTPLNILIAGDQKSQRHATACRILRET
ncbi:hypothetical protein C4D60_Mb05t00340 [Musa balbisiana]|uniref:Uncharacterized protein n=1 Tax=Musa balbisiana TaxID=52838 RepID=A0A4S8JSM4_MUSBA|nr:hypothetical protein C4D60_Mb05t00340 [Musa balbisiana]